MSRTLGTQYDHDPAEPPPPWDQPDWLNSEYAWRYKDDPRPMAGCTCSGRYLPDEDEDVPDGKVKTKFACDECASTLVLTVDTEDSGTIAIGCATCGEKTTHSAIKHASPIHIPPKKARRQYACERCGLRKTLLVSQADTARTIGFACPWCRCQTDHSPVGMRSPTYQDIIDRRQRERREDATLAVAQASSRAARLVEVLTSGE